MSNANNPALADSSNLDDWKKAAAKALRGAELETLNWVTPEGVAVKPLYTSKDLEGLP